MFVKNVVHPPTKRENAVAEGVLGVDVRRLHPVDHIRSYAIVHRIAGEVADNGAPKDRDGWSARESVIRCNL